MIDELKQISLNKKKKNKCYQRVFLQSLKLKNNKNVDGKIKKRKNAFIIQ